MDTLTIKQKIYLENLVKQVGAERFSEICSLNKIKNELTNLTKDEARILIHLMLNETGQNQNTEGIDDVPKKQTKLDDMLDKEADKVIEQLDFHIKSVKVVVALIGTELPDPLKISKEKDLFVPSKYYNYYLVLGFSHYDLIRLGLKHDKETSFYIYVPNNQ